MSNTQLKFCFSTTVIAGIINVGEEQACGRIFPSVLRVTKLAELSTRGLCTENQLSQCE